LFTSEPNWTKVVVIGAMVTLSGGLRFWQEFRSQKAMQKLQSLVQNTISVIRQGDHHHPGLLDGSEEVRIRDLVPGDIIELAAGDMLPGDIRLLKTDDLYVSQSALTGESMPVEKFGDMSKNLKLEKDEALDYPTLCFMGTNVVSGSGLGVVVTTGNNTYLGSLAKDVTGKRPLTSFDIGVNKVAWLLIRFMAVMVPIIFFLNGLTKGNWLEAFFFAMAVAIGLTPELLPFVVTANLAKGSIRMSKKKVIVKKLNAIQNFGAMDVLCTDKTGTLTENRIVLIRHLDVEGRESSRVLDLAYLNSHFQTGLKNLLDQAVVEYTKRAEPSHKNSYKKIDEIPFDFSRRCLSVIVQAEGAREKLLVCKGAVEQVLALCTKVEDNGAVTDLTQTERDKVTRLADDLSRDGLRVIAVAHKNLSGDKQQYTPADEQGLTLVGYIGFLDPPKTSAKAAVRLLSDYGVGVKIITGDNELVTEKICKEVGLPIAGILLGHELAKMDDKQLAKIAPETTIFARVDPLQKARVISALRASGHTVGYMGDGVNDAAAMRESDVGISVNTAADIAKEAADIILLESDLDVLGGGIIEGRTVFGNIMKYIKMTASSNFGNVFSVLVASAFLPFLPMLPLQLLIQNLFYDFSQLSIPWDNMDEDFLKQPRKWEARGIARFMLAIGPISSIFDITTFMVLWIVFGANTVGVQSLFQSGWFVEGLVSQVLVVHMIRSQKQFFRSWASWPVQVMTVLVIALGVVFPFSSVGQAVGLQPLPLAYFPWLIGTLICHLLLTDLVKGVYVRKFKAWL
jgi:P-type Mg2+ transporter